jgi:hypothetical protein
MQYEGGNDIENWNWWLHLNDLIDEDEITAKMTVDSPDSSYLLDAIMLFGGLEGILTDLEEGHPVYDSVVLHRPVSVADVEI